jgi:hypothetical protein
LEEEDPSDILLQQDRMPPHFPKIVMDFINHKFPEEWTGIGGPIILLPCLPDLTCHNLFFCGYIKDALYVSPLATTFAGTFWEDKNCNGYSYP